MRKLVMIFVLGMVTTILLAVGGLAFNAPALLVVVMFCSGPATFMMLGALLHAMSTRYRLVPKEADKTTVRVTTRAINPTVM
jgi:membrane protein required for beta-lactamase induction